MKGAVGVAEGKKGMITFEPALNAECKGQLDGENLKGQLMVKME